MSYQQIFKTYLDIIYDGKNNALFQKEGINYANKLVEVDSSLNFQPKPIISQEYFTKVSEKFEDYCVQLFDKMIPNIEKFQEYQKSGNEIFIDSYIDVSDLLNHLQIEKVKNVDNLQEFLKSMKNSEGQLHLQISNLSPNFYSTPINLIPKKVRIIEKTLDNLENQKFKVAQVEYEKFIEENTKKLKDINQKYEEAKKIALKISDWGTISIFSKYFTSDRNKFKNQSFGISLDIF